MDTTADSSVEGLFESNAPPSPSPAPRQVYPTSPKDISIASNLGFRPPPRPGSSTRKGRKSDFTTTSAPPPLPTNTLNSEYRALVDSTNLARNGSPTRSSSATSLFTNANDGKMVDITRIARERLQQLHQENEQQVNSAGMLGQGLLTLRTKIESLMDELAEELSAVDELSEDSAENGDKIHSARIRNLGDRIEAEIEDLERHKRSLFAEITSQHPDVTKPDDPATLLDFETPSKAARVANAIRTLTATPGKSPAPASTTPRPEDRRSRNAAARQAKADTELINEIQAGLVQEVRRLQSLLKERDDQRVAIERSHAEVEKQLEQYKPKVIQMTEAEDALKQENWDLSVAKQNLEEQLGQINSALKKAELENLRLTKDVAKARETVDSHRLQLDSQALEIDRLNKSRDTEIAQARKERAGMQRNVSDLQGELQRFRTQQLNERASVSRSVSNSFMSDTANDDMQQDADAITARLRAIGDMDSSRSPGESVYSADGATLSPLVNRLGRDKETQDLRSKLAMAQRKAGKDAAEKRRVREKNSELMKLLVQSGVKIPQGLDDDAESSEDEELQWMDEADAHSSPSAKRLHHIRSARPPANRPRLGKLMGMASSTSTDSIVEYAEYEDEQEGSTMQEEESDGIDPAFADVQPDPADVSTDSQLMRPVRRGHRARMSVGGSPLARSSQLPVEEESPHQRTIGRRSGANAVRSISTVFQPSALGNELDGLALEPEQPDLVTPALAERDLQHAETVKGIYAEHAKFVEAIHADHAAAVDAIHATHAQDIESIHSEHTTKVTQLVDQHTAIVTQLKESHQTQIDTLIEAHAQSLTESDEKHAASLASAIAERNATHEAAVTEARSRHSRALAEQVAASSAALASAHALHKTSSEDFDRKHREERERKDASHAYALSQLQRQHQEALDAVHVAHAGDLSVTRDEHAKVISNMEDGISKTRDEHAQTLASKEQALTEAKTQLEQVTAQHTEVLTTKDQALVEARLQLEQAVAEHTEVVASKERALSDALTQLEQVKSEHAEVLATNKQALSETKTQLEQAKAQHAELSASKEKAITEAESKLEQTRSDHAEQLASKDRALSDATAQHEQTRTEHSQILADKERTISATGAELERTKTEHAEQLASKENTITAAAEALEQVKTEHARAMESKEQSLQQTTAQLEQARTEHADALSVKDKQLQDVGVELEQVRKEHTAAVAAREQSSKDAASKLEERAKAFVALEATQAAALLSLRNSHAQDLAARDQELAQTKAEVEELQQTIKSLTDELVQLRKQLSDLEHQHSSTSRELDETKSNLSLAHEKVRRQEEAASELVRQKEAEAVAAAAAVAARSEALSATEVEKEQLEASHLLAIAQKERQHNDALKLLDDNHHTTISNIRAEHKETLAARDRDVQTHKAEVEQLRSSHKTDSEKLRSTISGHEQENETLRTTITRHEEEAIKLRETMAGHEVEVDKLRSAIITHEQEGEKLRGVVTVHEQEAERLRTETSGHKQEAEKLRGTITSHEQEIEKLRSTVSTHQEEAEKLRGTITTHEQEIEKLRSTVSTHEQESTQLRSNVETHIAEALLLRQAVQLHQDASAKLREDVTTHKTEADSLRSLVDSHKNEASQLRDAAQMHKQESDTLRDLVETHMSEASTLRERVQGHQDEAETLRATVQTHKDEAETLRASAQSHKQESDKLQEIVQTHVAELASLRATAQSLEQQLAKAQSDTASTQQSRSVVEQQLAKSKAEYESLQKQQEDAKTTIASLQSKVRYLESAIAAEKSSTEQNRLSSDKELQTIQSALNTAQKKVRDQERLLSKTEAALAAAAAATAIAESQLLAKNDLVTDTENEAFEDAMETPRAYKSPVQPDLKESSCQTDDVAWNLYKQQQQQQQQQAADSQTGTVVILGGAQMRPRDSVGTFGGSPAELPAPAMYTPEAVTGALGRRKSTDSTRSRRANQITNEVIPPVPALPDKSKPPMMVMPGPPQMPPPARAASISSGPQRPLSPPPADLLARAQQRHLQIPGGGDQNRSSSRTSGRSGPPPTSSRIRQASSGAGSVRSRTTSGDTANSLNPNTDKGVYGTMLLHQHSLSSRKSTPGSKSTRRPTAGARTTSSTASFVSDVTSEVSRRMSMMSSAASEAGEDGDNTFMAPGAGLGQFGAEATDPLIIHAITQTMIGEYMHKYTRKSMGRVGHSDKRHKRYFWVHPYTKMLYWTMNDPGGRKVTEGTSKSAVIRHVRVVQDFNPSPPCLHHESLVITTASREVKITAPSRDRHEAWLAALQYLVHRPTIQDATTIAQNVAGVRSDAEKDGRKSSTQRRKPRASVSTIGSRLLSPEDSLISRRSVDRVQRTESTPQKSVRGGGVLYPSMGKRSELAAKEWLQLNEYDRDSAMSPSRSVRSRMYEASGDLGDESYDMMDLTATQIDPRLKTAEEMLEEDEPEGFDGLTNVRACCDGRHDVGSLAHTHTHRREGGYSSDRGSRKSNSGGSRLSSAGLKSKLDAAVRAAEEREREPVPQLPHPIRRSTDKNAPPATFANLFAPMESATTAGPSYGERVAKIKQRQSLDTTAATAAPSSTR